MPYQYLQSPCTSASTVRKEEKVVLKPRRRKVFNWKNQATYTHHMRLSDWLTLKGDPLTTWDYVSGQDERSSGPKLVQIASEWFIELLAMGPPDLVIESWRNKEDTRPESSPGDNPPKVNW